MPQDFLCLPSVSHERILSYAISCHYYHNYSSSSYSDPLSPYWNQLKCWFFHRTSPNLPEVCTDIKRSFLSCSNSLRKIVESCAFYQGTMCQGCFSFSFSSLRRSCWCCMNDARMYPLLVSVQTFPSAVMDLGQMLLNVVTHIIRFGA